MTAIHSRSRGCTGLRRIRGVDRQARLRASRHDELIEVMAAIVEGDEAAPYRLLDLARGPLRFMIRRFWREMTGREPDLQDLQDLVLDATLELARLAPSWSPTGGATPWHWARLRIRALVSEHIGILADPIEDHEEQLTAGDEPTGAPLDGEEAATHLRATADPSLRLLGDGLMRVASHRDQAVWLEYTGELSIGSRRPAVTVAANHGLAPTTVRKVVQRVGDRLVHLARSECGFAALLDLPAVNRHVR